VVQYIDSLGNIAWGDSGVQVTNRPDVIYANSVAVVSDGYGGAFVGWSERVGDYTVFIQRVDSSGQIVLANNGIALTNNSLRNIDVSISSDTQGGAIISWSSLVSAGSQDTSYKYVQRVSATGDLLWGPEGVRIGTVKGGGARRHTSDGEGGAYIGHGRWIQHISVEGELSWQGEGAPYTLQPSVFFNSSQTRNGSQGMWNFWSQDTGGLTSVDIYGQYIDGSGNVSWESNGKPICTVEHLQDWAKATSGDDGTAIVVWMDYRNNRTNVFASKVDAEGIITKVEDQDEMLPSTPYLEQNYPNPFNPSTTIKYQIPKSGIVTIIVYDILGKEVTTLVDDYKPRGIYEINFNANNLSSGVYIYRITAASNGRIIFTDSKQMILLR
jgi:Secretion system C-terminal sorting domain